MGKQRGQDTRIELFSNGELIATVAANNFSANIVMETERTQRLGSRTEPVDSDGPRGYEGDIEFEVENFALDDLEDALIAGHLNGDPITKIDIIDTNYIPANGQTRTYVYPEAVFTIAKSVGGRRDPVTRRMNWESELRELL